MAPRMAFADKDEVLRDDCNLEVGDHVGHTIAGRWGTWLAFGVKVGHISGEQPLG